MAFQREYKEDKEEFDMKEWIEQHQHEAIIVPQQITPIDENKFLVWVNGLDPNAYPICNGIIKRVQKYHRKSFVLDILRLVNEYIKADHKD